MANYKYNESLRVEKHPRGHVATCNASIEEVEAKVEPCYDFENFKDAKVSENVL